MANVKTAVSLPRGLFERAEELARKVKASRSRLFALALEEFIRRHEARELIEKINAAYEETDESTEATLRLTMRRLHRKAVEGEW